MRTIILLPLILSIAGCSAVRDISDAARAVDANASGIQADLDKAVETGGVAEPARPFRSIGADTGGGDSHAGGDGAGPAGGRAGQDARVGQVVDDLGLGGGRVGFTWCASIPVADAAPNSGDAGPNPQHGSELGQVDGGRQSGGSDGGTENGPSGGQGISQGEGKTGDWQMTAVLIWFAITSQVGLVAIGWLLNIYLDSTAKELVREVRDLIDTVLDAPVTAHPVRPSDD